MRYYVEDGIHTVQCSVDEFSLVLYNERKKNVEASTYMNANFFGNFNENGEVFTLPAGNLVCDYEGQGHYLEHYCKERGKFIGNKFYFDSNKWGYANQFYNKAVTTFIIENDKARVEDITDLKDSFQYVVAGVPIMLNGQDVDYYNYVVKQGWDASVLYATKHIFLGLKDDGKIYVMGYKTTTSNMIYSAEMYKKLSKLGYKDVVKFDGGGSYMFKFDGAVKDSTTENRRCNAFIVVTGEVEPDPEPAPEPVETKDEPSSWAKAAWDKGVKKGYVDGTNPQGGVTREMLMVVFDSLGQL